MTENSLTSLYQTCSETSVSEQVTLKYYDPTRANSTIQIIDLFDNGVIEQVYCTIDDCIHSFLKIPAGKKNLALYYDKRGPKRRMALADVVALNRIRIFDRTGDLKTSRNL